MNDLTNEENSKPSQNLDSPERKDLDLGLDQKPDQKLDPESLQLLSPEPKGKNKLQISLLSIFLGGALLILGRSLLDGNIGKPAAFTFPEQIDWTKNSELSNVAPNGEPRVIIDNKNFYGKPRYSSGQSYKYLVNGLPLDVDIRYLFGTSGNILLFLKELANLEIDEDKLRQQVRKNAIGYYLIFEYQNRAYLTACINPRGISTATREQFDDNASKSASDREVIIKWLLGQTDLRDRRCLWTILSTPFTASSDRAMIDQKLEKVWILWYEWWKIRFPQP
jgi:cyanosortase A-associated protein